MSNPWGYFWSNLIVCLMFSIVCSCLRYFHGSLLICLLRAECASGPSYVGGYDIVVMNLGFSRHVIVVQVTLVLCQLRSLTLLVMKRIEISKTLSLLWLMVFWLLAASGYQQSLYWLCGIIGYLYQLGRIPTSCNLSLLKHERREKYNCVFVLKKNARQSPIRKYYIPYSK